MPSIYDLYQTDKNLEAGEGIEIDYGDYGVFIIRRAGGQNSLFNRVVTQKTKPVRRQLDQGTLPDSKVQELWAEIYAEAVIIGWRGIKGRDGKEIKFSKQTCKQVLLDLPDLFADLQDQARRAENFKAEELEAAAKNS